MKTLNRSRLILILAALFLVGNVAGAIYPSAAFNATPTSGFRPMAVQFTDQSTGSPNGWSWFFGDETYSQSWTTVTPAAGWPARDTPVSVVMPDSSILVMGGWGAFPDNYFYQKDIWRSTDNGATWTLVNESPEWGARNGHTAVALPHGQIVLMGGIAGIVVNETWRSEDNGRIWKLINGSPGWMARYSHTSVAMPDGSIVLMGGNTYDGRKNDVWRSTDNGETWSLQTAHAGWSPRYGHTSVVMPDGSIVLMGGLREGGIQTNDVWRSTDNGVTWTQMTAGAAWAHRFYHTSVAMPDGSIVLMGGSTVYGDKNDVWRSTDFGASWTQLPDAAWPVRQGLASVMMPDSSILVMGGSNSSGNVKTNDVWRLSPAGSIQQNPLHTYRIPGKYTVALQVRSPVGHDSMLAPGYITVAESAPPTVDRIQPGSGTQNKFVTITNLSGTKFRNGVKVYLTKSGNTAIAATNVTVVSPEKIRCTVKIPAGTTIGPWSVMVTNNDGKSGVLVKGFMVKSPSPPTVTGIVPASGKRSTIVQVTRLAGTGFANGAKVQIVKNGVMINAINVSVVSGKNITCTFKIPAGASIGPWNVRVTNADGQYGTAAAVFMVKTASPPAVTGISPSTGRTGRTVQIANLAGTGFVASPKPTVQLLKGSQKITATNVTVVSASRITCTFKIPTNATTGAWNVRVTNADWQAGGKAAAFTVTT